jgi:NADH-quinone oxidoreductase subunit I
MTAGLSGRRAGMTQEFEWSTYDKQDLFPNKQQLLAIGDRNFPYREKRLELQHPNVAFFNVALPGSPQKESKIADGGRFQ